MSTTVNALGIVLFANNRERLPNGTILFDTVEIDQFSTMEFRIRNRSDVDVLITNISLKYAEEYNIVSECTFSFPITLAPNEEFEFEMNVFSELEHVELFDFLKIESDVAGAPLDYRLQIKVTESTDSGGGSDTLPPEPGTLSVTFNYSARDSNELVDFGQQSAGTYSWQGFLVNESANPVTITDFALTGDGEFSLVVDPTPVTLLPTENALFQFDFSSLVPGIYSLMIEMFNDGTLSPFVLNLQIEIMSGE